MPVRRDRQAPTGSSVLPGCSSFETDHHHVGAKAQDWIRGPPEIFCNNSPRRRGLTPPRLTIRLLSEDFLHPFNHIALLCYDRLGNSLEILSRIGIDL